MPQKKQELEEGSIPPEMNTSEIWKIALEQIKLHVSPQNFSAWFKNTSLSTIENGIATIECPNSFAKEWLDTNHHRLITRIIRSIVNQNVDIVFAVSSKRAKDPDEQKDSTDTRYDDLSIAPEEAPLFHIEYTHGNLVQEAQQKASLNNIYLFDNFVVGSSNRLAHAAAEAIAENPGHAYNPFFIYGGVGLGKTHLSQAIGNRIIQNDPNKKLRYCPSETFLNELVEGIRNDRTSNFRDNYRQLDVLIIDDIQFISKWESAQIELFHTFNTLYQSNKQIILISDRPPKEIDNLVDRLRSRFEGGMVADISQPDYELRIAIVRLKAQEKEIILPENILSFIAKSVDDNIRELEGALMRISTHVKISGVIPDEEDIAKILEIDPESKRKKNTPRDVIQEICRNFGVSIREVRGKRRTAEIVIPRQVCMYVLRKDLELPLEQIARELNRSDHTTVMHAIDRVEEKLEEDEEFKDRVGEVRV